jgi:hypothetical protein
MVIFHSYVSLPEGKWIDFFHFSRTYIQGYKGYYHGYTHE